jgi:hypothetical protein
MGARGCAICWVVESMSTSHKRQSFVNPKGSDLAIRCHDVVVSLNGRQVGEFEQLSIAGMAARLALHLRGAPVIPYETLRLAALHLLQIPATALRSVLEFLAEVEFVRLDLQGRTIRAVVPTVPYYEDMFRGIGESVESKGLCEAEQLTAILLHRLAAGLMSKEGLHDTGAEKRLLRRMTNVGEERGYFISRRARGRDIIISPVYFPENIDAFADIAAGQGSNRVANVVSLLAENQS